MWPFRRRPQPAYKSKAYTVEMPATQLRIIRTHMAAMAGEISTLNVLVGQLGAKLDQVGQLPPVGDMAEICRQIMCEIESTRYELADPGVPR